MAGAAAAGGARGFLVVRALTRSHSFSPSASHTIFGIVDNSSRVAAPGDSPRRRAPTRYDLVRTAAHSRRAGRAGVKTRAARERSHRSRDTADPHAANTPRGHR